MAIRDLHADMKLRNRELEAEDFRPVIIAFILFSSVSHMRQRMLAETVGVARDLSGG